MYIFQSRKYFIKYSKKLKVVFTSRSLKNSHQKQNILLLSIIVSEALYKKGLFGYAILVQENKQSTFSLSHLTEHYSSVYEETYLDSELKSETFALTQKSLIIQRKTQTHNSHNLFKIIGSPCFEMPQKRF